MGTPKLGGPGAMHHWFLQHYCIVIVNCICDLYLGILRNINNHIPQPHVHSMVQTLFPSRECTFQNDNVPIHRSQTVQSWFKEHEGEVAHLPWPVESPDINIIEPLWSVLENRVQSRYSATPASLKELEKFLLEEWYDIPPSRACMHPFHEGFKQF